MPCGDMHQSVTDALVVAAVLSSFSAISSSLTNIMLNKKFLSLELILSLILYVYAEWENRGDSRCVREIALTLITRASAARVWACGS